MKKFNQILPAEIISDILSRLPADSVLECKSVCKTWKNLVQQPSFPKTHLARLNSADSGKLRYVFMKEDDPIDDYECNKRLYYFEFNENEDWNHVTPVHRKINIEPRCEAYILIGSFNGLICVYGTQPSTYDAHGPAIILNPVTKEYIILPDFDCYPEYETKGENAIRYNHLACGFGYLAETNEYKVVRIYKCAKEQPNVVEVEVYTLGSGKGWGHVGKFDLGFRFYPHWEHRHGVYLNGCLHWRNKEGGTVVVFDLAEEKFREHIPPPPLLTGTDDDEDFNGFIVIGVSGGGSLYYAAHQFLDGHEVFNGVWLLTKKNDNHVMKEHEDHQLWGWSQVTTSLDQTEPFAFMEGGSTVIRLNQGNFQIFLSSTSTWENIANSDISRQVFPHRHTFISLKELGEEDAKIMKGIEETDCSESGSD